MMINVLHYTGERWPDGPAPPKFIGRLDNGGLFVPRVGDILSYVYEDTSYTVKVKEVRINYDKTQNPITINLIVDRQ